MKKLLQNIACAASGIIMFCQPMLAISGSSGAPRVIPRPQMEEHGQGTIQLGQRDANCKVSFRNIRPEESAPCNQGFRLLSKRLTLLGAGNTILEKVQSEAQIVIEKALVEDFSRILRDHGVKEVVTGKRLEQAYVLECRTSSGNRGSVYITACGDLGIYYGFISLCQLMDNDNKGGICLPVVKIADWPEIGLRLAKTSASANSLPALRQYASWMPLYKINLMGLQFHGTNSKDPGPFAENIKAICSRAPEGGILETIVYFCPFRGKGFDFNRPADQRQYAQFLQWMLDQGAHGIEVDYNDWPGKETPIEDVINLACRAVAEKNPRAYILYCPPNKGNSQYRGPASPEMRRILSNVPTNVWPLWTGMATLIEKPLKVTDVEEWTRVAGRRPFLWVNRVTLQGERPFSRPVSEVAGAVAFRGELLPKELNRLFEGVHFNAILPSRSRPEVLAYLATAADYIWNPQGWEAVESCRRAKRFAEIMQSLVEE